MSRNISHPSGQQKSKFQSAHYHPEPHFAANDASEIAQRRQRFYLNVDLILILGNLQKNVHVDDAFAH